MSRMTKTNWSDFPNFTPKEFACKCGCEKECINMDIRILFIAQTLRIKYGPVTITCGHRCQKYNDSLTGSVKNSYHIKKKAMDFYIPGKCDTEKGRLAIIEELKKFPGYKYAYCNVGGNHPNMGNAIHVEVE